MLIKALKLEIHCSLDSWHLILSSRKDVCEVLGWKFGYQIGPISFIAWNKLPETV